MPGTYANHVAVHEALDAAPILERHGLGGVDLAAFIVINRHAGHSNRECWLSYETIARESLWRRRAISDAIQRLKDEGFIEIPGKHSSRVYRYRIVTHDTDRCAKCKSARDACMPQTHVCPKRTSKDALDTVLGVRETHRIDAPDAHKVVNGLEKEVVKGNRSISLVPAAVPKAKAGFQVRRKGGRDTSQAIHSSYPGTQEQNSSTPPASGPAALLAQEYLSLLGHLPEHHPASIAKWPHIFDQLLQRYKYTDLKAIAEFAFLEDGFWCDKMFRIGGDPVEYFADKVSTIAASRQKTEAQKKRARSSGSSGAPQESSIDPGTKSLMDSLLNYN